MTGSFARVGDSAGACSLAEAQRGKNLGDDGDSDETLPAFHSPLRQAPSTCLPTMATHCATETAAAPRERTPTKNEHGCAAVSAPSRRSISATLGEPVSNLARRLLAVEC
jgi:hypothetical protein